MKRSRDSQRSRPSFRSSRVSSHEHDLLVAYAAAAWCALRTHGTTRAVALAGTLLVAVDWLGLAQRPTGIVQSALLALAALLAFIALGEARESPSAVDCGCCRRAALWRGRVIGAHHPAPVWPDALAGFRADPAASAAQVWLAEQRAERIARRGPRVGAAARSLTSRMRAAGLRYISTSNIWSNGVNAPGW